MTVKDQIQALTKKEMDRKDFLKYSGTLLLAVIGVTGFLRIVLGSHELSKPTASDNKNEIVSAGYGSSPYGR